MTRVAYALVAALAVALALTVAATIDAAPARAQGYDTAGWWSKRTPAQRAALKEAPSVITGGAPPATTSSASVSLAKKVVNLSKPVNQGGIGKAVVDLAKGGRQAASVAARGSGWGTAAWIGLEYGPDVVMWAKDQLIKEHPGADLGSMIGADSAVWQSGIMVVNYKRPLDCASNPGFAGQKSLFREAPSYTETQRCLRDPTIKPKCKPWIASGSVASGSYQYECRLADQADRDKYRQGTFRDTPGQPQSYDPVDITSGPERGYGEVQDAYEPCIVDAECRDALEDAMRDTPGLEDPAPDPTPTPTPSPDPSPTADPSPTPTADPSPTSTPDPDPGDEGDPGSAPGTGPGGSCGWDIPSPDFDLPGLDALKTLFPFSLLLGLAGLIGGAVVGAERPDASFSVFGRPMADLSFLENFDGAMEIWRAALVFLFVVAATWFTYERTIGAGE